VYNGEQYLRFAIESVLHQTFQDFELVIVDDGSKDSTPVISQSYGDRVRYLPQENTGVAGAFNHGLRLAAGRYISWLSHDDVFLSTKLEKQVAALQQIAEPAICYTDVQMIDSSGAIIREYRLPQYDRQEALRHVLTGGEICWASYSVMYDRRCVEEVGGYSESWRYTQDVDMLARFARRFPLIRVPELLMQVREHENRGVRSKNWEREVFEFFRDRLDNTPFEELFCDLGETPTRSQKGAAYLYLADNLAAQSYPIYRLAYSQYRKALREDPADAARLLRRIVGLYWRRRRSRS
jgi:glycosyltransferase involved in cell wall biosynthesis